MITKHHIPRYSTSRELSVARKGIKCLGRDLLEMRAQLYRVITILGRISLQHQGGNLFSLFQASYNLE